MTSTVVLGAGIVGASIAYHLARAGAEVTLLDKDLPGTGATGASFAWIGKGPEAQRFDQSALRAHVVDDYRRLEEQVPGVQVRWTGSLCWDDDEAVRQEPRSQDRLLITAVDVAHLEPALLSPPPVALRITSDGAIDPTAAVEALLAAARGYGADIRAGVSARRLRVRDERVVGVETADGSLTADSVVIATGTDAPLLCAPLGFHLPVAGSPAILLRFAAAPDVVRTLVSNDQVEVRQAGEGTLLAAREHRGEGTEAQLRATGEAVAAHLRSSFVGAESIELLSAEVGTRPMPVDGSPVIGPVPGADGAYLAVVHSGVTLAAPVGRLVAAEILDGAVAVELEGLRPTRFLD